MPDAHPPRAALAKLLGTLTTGEAVPQPEDEPWDETIRRLLSEQIIELTEETWFYYLEVLPPKLHRGGWFAFAEGQEQLTLFWRRHGQHFARRLTWEQTFQLCDATGLRRDYGCV
jgi:hypothetical protein